MRKLRQLKAWASDFTCSECGAKLTYYHGIMSKKNATRDMPTYDPKISWSGYTVGWFVGIRNKEICPECVEIKEHAGIFYK